MTDHPSDYPISYPEQLNRRIVSAEPCGVCFLPSPLCKFYIGKGKARGRNKLKKITHVEGCKSTVDFAKVKYAVAEKSTETVPSSNFPIQCPQCSPNDAAIWRYNLHYHFTHKYLTADLAQYKHLWKLSDAEYHHVKEVWDKHKRAPKPRKSKSKKGKELEHRPLVISDAHSARLALRTTDLQETEKSKDDEGNDTVCSIVVSGARLIDDADFIVDSSGESKVESEEEEKSTHGTEDDNDEAEDGVDYEQQSEIFDALTAQIAQSEGIQLPASGLVTTEPLDCISPPAESAVSGTQEPMVAPSVNTCTTRKRKAKEVERIFECFCGQVVENRDDRDGGSLQSQRL